MRSQVRALGMPAEPEEKRRRFYFGDVFKGGKYAPLHPELFQASAPGAWERWLAPGFKEVAAAVRDGDPLRALREEAPGVYSFELFTPEFCDLLLEEVENAQATAREHLERPNGMNRYGIVLNQLGLEPLISALQQEHLKPMQEALYPGPGTGPDDHHCFIVRYKAGEDVGLDMHEDDADVTLNVCLGKEFTAATLSFCGQAKEQSHRKFKATYSHQKGRAVVHLGTHRHGADNIESGERVNFILWSISSGYRGSEAYRKDRTRSTASLEPDRVCLSYTHDRDYTQHLPRPSREEAVARGVMLDVVEERRAVMQRPVHDLSRPIEEINSVPSVCLFLDGLPPQRQHGLFRHLMEVAAEVHGALGRRPHDAGPPPLLFFVGVQPTGAAPQVRQLCGVKHSPALALLDVDKEAVYRLPADREVGPEALQEFVGDYLKGSLRAHKLGSEQQEEEDAAAAPAATDGP